MTLRIRLGATAPTAKTLIDELNKVEDTNLLPVVWGLRESVINPTGFSPDAHLVPLIAFLDTALFARKGGVLESFQAVTGNTVATYTPPDYRSGSAERKVLDRIHDQAHLSEMARRGRRFQTALVHLRDYRDWRTPDVDHGPPRWMDGKVVESSDLSVDSVRSVAREWTMHTAPEADRGKREPRRVYTWHMARQKLSASAFHEIFSELADRILADSALVEAWESLTPIMRNEWICWIAMPKKQSTRDNHLERALDEMRAGKRNPCCWPGCPHRRESAKKYFKT